MEGRTEKGRSKSPWGGRGLSGLGKLKRVYCFEIPGRPVTKKNSGRYCGPGRFRPSAAYEAYEAVAVPTLKNQRKKLGINYPIDRPCELYVHYYMPSRAAWPDLVGLMQATADLLEAAGVLEDDRLILSWQGTNIEGIDKNNPRAEITLYPVWLRDDTREFWMLDPMTKRRLENGYYGC